jgi:hypothetical protein
MSGETVRLAWGAAWLVSGQLARPGPFKLRPVMADSSCRGCDRCWEWTAARSGLREGPGAGLGRFCLKRVAWVPGPIKPQSCRGGIPSGGEVAL